MNRSAPFHAGPGTISPIIAAGKANAMTMADAAPSRVSHSRERQPLQDEAWNKAGLHSVAPSRACARAASPRGSFTSKAELIVCSSRMTNTCVITGVQHHYFSSAGRNGKDKKVAREGATFFLAYVLSAPHRSCSGVMDPLLDRFGALQLAVNDVPTERLTSTCRASEQWPLRTKLQHAS